MVTVKLQNLKITARKVRMVADLIRNKPVTQAEALLRFTPRKASQPMLKLLQSGMAAAKNAHKLDPNGLYISRLMVNDGPMQERVFPRSRGRADKIQKRTSHITMILEQREVKAPKAVKQETKKAAKAVVGLKKDKSV